MGVEHRADDVEKGKGDRKLLALASKERLIRILEKMLDEKEFLSDYGVRSCVPPVYGRSARAN
jgi:hypothetical protein